jgi:hypothetical protein
MQIKIEMLIKEEKFFSQTLPSIRIPPRTELLREVDQLRGEMVDRIGIG